MFFKKISPRTTCLFCSFRWNDPAGTRFSAVASQLFSQSLSSITLCRCLEMFFTFNNICNFWQSKFQQASNHAFCSWYDLFTQEENCSSPKKLFKCTKSQPTLSTNAFIEWILYLSWSNHLVTSFRLKMSIGGFSKHQNKTSELDRYEKSFFTARISLVNVNTIKKFFEQWSELKVTKGVIVHVVSTIMMCRALCFEMKR